MNFLALLWVGNFDYIWYKIIDHGGIGRYETRIIPDDHPREGEIYIIMKTVLAQLYSAHLSIQIDEGFTRYDPASGY